MRKLMLAGAAAAAALFATPALAQTNAGFTGVRGELQAGVDNLVDTPEVSDIRYGAVVGVDAGLGDRFTIGAEATASDVFDNEGRTYGVGARLGYAVTPSTLLFARAGYENMDDAFNRKLDGLAVGGGIEHRLSPHTFVSAQYRYTDFEQGVGRHGGLIGIGIRF